MVVGFLFSGFDMLRSFDGPLVLLLLRQCPIAKRMYARILQIFSFELIYVTSQGSQLTVEALELILKSFAQPCFACHVSAISFGMVKAWIETIHGFRNLFIGLSAGRSIGPLSVVPPGPRPTP